MIVSDASSKVMPRRIRYAALVFLALILASSSQTSDGKKPKGKDGKSKDKSKATDGQQIKEEEESQVRVPGRHMTLDIILS